MLEPIASGQWDNVKAAHLLNRAGFGGPPAAIQKLADLGPSDALSSLLDYEKILDATTAPDWAKPDPDAAREFRQAIKNATPEEKKKLQREKNQQEQREMLDLRGWWLQRMATGPRPMQEKLTLFWHGHFATSVQKVRNPYYMWRQNELFRRLATGNWLQLLTEAGKDPAMLVWLDQAQSRKSHANENYAREVMELFSLGEGHYTEKDVTEGARALTGWSLDPRTENFIYRPALHDTGIKTYLGQTGNFDGDDVMRIIVSQPQAARFITGKLWTYFAGQEPTPALSDALADVFRQHGNDFKPFLRVLFSSQEFYSPDIIRNQVKSPVDWLVSSVRMLENQLPPPVISWGMLRQLGQDIFAPPNVKGWDGGVTWITTNTLLTRYNDAQTLVEGTLPPLSAHDFAGKNGTGGKRAMKAVQRVRLGEVDVEKILTPDERADKGTLVAALEIRLFQKSLHADQEQTLREFLDAKTKMTDADILTTIRLMMSTPEFQIT